MSLQKVRIGILDLELPVQSDNLVPSALSITPTVSDIPLVSGLSKTDNDINPPLSTSDTYQFVIGFVGEDRTNGGYTVAVCSRGSGIATIAAASNGLRISVLNGSLPTFYDEAVAMAVFVKINGSSKYQLCKLAYIDPDGDFNTIITHKPLLSAPKFDLSLLQAATVDPTLGSRVGNGFTFQTATPTTQEITERYQVTTVSVSPNTGPDFNIRTSVASGLEFKLLLNDIKNFVDAVGGYWAKYNDVSGLNEIEEGMYSLATAQAIFRGNRPVRVTYPPDGLGNAEIALFLGLLTFNQTELTAAWSKSADTPVNFVFESAILDGLINSQHAKVSYKKRVL